MRAIRRARARRRGARAQDRAGSSEALLERGFANLVLGERNQANNDFNRVLRLVPPDSSAARRAQAGLRGVQPVPAAGRDASAAAGRPKGRRQAVASAPSLM